MTMTVTQELTWRAPLVSSSDGVDMQVLLQSCGVQLDCGKLNDFI